MLPDFTAEVQDLTNIKNILKKNADSIKWSFIFTFILGLAAHAFQFLNMNASHDFAIEIFSNRERHHYQIALGRVLEPFYKKFTGSDTSMPWTAGCIAIVWIALAVFLTCKMLHLNKKHEIFIVSGIFVTNQTVLCIVATYIPWLGADMFAMLCAVAAAFIWRIATENKKYLLIPIGALITAISLGLYQSFITVTIVLVMICCIAALLEGRKSLRVFTDGLCAIGMILGGAGIYYILIQIICAITGVTLIEDSYNTVSNIWSNTEPFFTRILKCYSGVKELLWGSISSVYPAYAVRTVSIILLSVTLFFIVRQAIKIRMKPVAVLLLVVLAVLLPLGANVIRLLNPIVHDLMTFAVWLLYLLPPVIAAITFKKSGTENDTEKLNNSGKPKKYLSVVRIVTCFFLCVTLYGNIQTANLAYVTKSLEHQSTLSAMTNIMYEAEHTDGYVEGETPLIFIGSLGNCVSELPEKFRVSDITGLSENSAVTYDFQSYLKFMLQKTPKILNYSSDPLDKELYSNILSDPALLEMPIYPNQGFIQVIDGVVVIKFY